MREFILRRLLSLIPTMLILTIVVFALIHILPGDAALALLGEEMGDQETYLQLRKEMGLDDPLPVRYAKWLSRVLQGDLGRSTRTGRPVADMLIQRAPISLYVGLVGLLLGMAIGLPIAVMSALKPNSSTDVIGTFIALCGIAIPDFWLALMLMLVFGVYLRWLPPSGYVSPFRDPSLSLKLLIMPAIVAGTNGSANLMRQGRAAVIEVLRQDYITTARAKGLREKIVIYRHALKNAMIPVTTIMGLRIGRLVSGAAIIETVFAIPGVGRMAVDAIFYRDYVALQGAVLMLTFVTILGNLLADITYAYLDPRIRYQ